VFVNRFPGNPPAVPGLTAKCGEQWIQEIRDNSGCRGCCPGGAWQRETFAALPPVKGVLRGTPSRGGSAADRSRAAERTAERRGRLPPPGYIEMRGKI